MDVCNHEENKQIQDMLQELCVAEYVQSYCSSCTSGGGCCAEENTTAMENASHNDETTSYKSNETPKPRRTTLTIDLSKDGNLSDGEILKRLLSPLGSILSDEPLEVILEIVGEEEDEGDEETCSTTLQTLRDRLNNVHRHSHNRTANEDTFSNYHDRTESESTNCKSENSKQAITGLGNLENKRHFIHASPSYKKANALIGEIENCFMETASLVEKTLGSVKTQYNQEPIIPICEKQKAHFNSDISLNKGENQKRKQLTETVEEALHIFDSIIYGNKDLERPLNQNYLDNKFKEETITKEFVDISNSNYHIRTPDKFSQSDSETNTNTYQDEHISNCFSQEIESDHRNEIFLKKYACFEKDVDELFKECYELSSVEPSTSLGSCLKNLENLCSQLKKAKQNILQEIDESRASSVRNSQCFEDSDLQTLTVELIDQKRFSLINELIERKLRSKLKLEKFNKDPPMIGLEGKTHKLIAEVPHAQNLLENDQPLYKENGFTFPGSKADYGNNNDETNVGNYLYADFTDQNDYAYESNSEMSITTNTMDSNSFVSSQMDSAPESRNENRICENFDSFLHEKSNYTTMTHDDSLALYEDNQELQQSLLSILHNLNDIHDNFLNRRRVETALAQRSSNFLQNSIRAKMNSSAETFSDTYSSTLVSNEPVTNYNEYVSDNFRLPTDGKQILSEQMAEDFDSIEKIAKVSDELKNLWLYKSEDVRVKPPQKTRSVSFNRSYRSRIHKRIAPGELDNLYTMNEKCYSLPNLSVDPDSEEHNFPSKKRIYFPQHSNQYSQNVDNNSKQQSNFFAENFVKKMKIENEKCYQVTLNFLQRIMEARKILEHDADDRRKAFIQRGLYAQSEAGIFGDSFPQSFEQMDHEEDADPYPQTGHQIYDAYMRTY